MENNNYTILDNFNQEVKNFDMVSTASNKQGVLVSEIAMYYDTKLFVFSDFDNIDSRNTLISVRKNTLWGAYRNACIVDRVQVEIGELPGRYKMKNIIKIDDTNNVIAELRKQYIYKLSQFCITSSVPRKTVNDVLRDAKKLGYCSETV